MTRRHTFVGAVVALGFAASGSASATPTPAPNAHPKTVNVSLLNINDFHGHLDDNGANLACLVEQRRKAAGDDNTLLLGNGDNIGGSPFVSASAGDVPTMKYLNALEVETSSVGNHEFDKGYDDLTDRVEDTVDFPYLGANVYEAGTTTPALQEYTIRKIKGVRVAIVGAVTADTPNIVMPDGIKDVSFGDPVAAVNRVATKLKRYHKADVVVAAYHAGAVDASGDLAKAQASLPEFNDIVTKTSGRVDAILNAHTHQTYTYDAPKPGGGTRPIIQSASYGKLLGQIDLTLDRRSKKIVGYTQQNLPTKGVDLTKCVNDTRYLAAKKVIDDAVAEASVTGNVVIAKQTADILRGKGESPLSNLDADAWHDQLNQPGRPGADLAIMNPGGVRADLTYAPSGKEAAGEITFAEAFAVNPFANTLQVVTLTGAQLRTLFEQQWTGKPADQVIPMLGVSKNVHYTFDATKPEGSRVTSLTVNGKTVADTDQYRVGGGSFLIGGGDGYTVLKSGTNKVDTGLNDADEFVAWLKAHSPVSPDLTHRGEPGTGTSTTAPAPAPATAGAALAAR